MSRCQISIQFDQSSISATWHLGKKSFWCFLSRSFDDKDLIVVGRSFHSIAPYIKLIVSHTGECLFGLKTDHQVLIALYCENELMNFCLRYFGSRRVLAH